MNIVVKKITDYNLMNKACGFTTGNYNVSPDPHKMYKAEHSPARTQMFTVEMYGIPTFVSVHFVRHSVWVQHFVRSNREDRGGNAEANRMTPVDHLMFLNAQALINMARKRLCHKASKETREIMEAIKLGVWEHDAALHDALVADCKYRGACYELKPCAPHMEKTAKEGGAA